MSRDRRRGGMRRVAGPFLALLLSACGAAQAPSASAPSDEPVIGDWVLVDGTIDGADAPVLADHRITLSIAGRTISGVAACNHYGGEVAAGDGGLRLTNLSQTEMACAEPAMSAESTYLGALARVRQIVRDGDALVASGEGVELRFDALRAPPTSELIDTRWVLETVLVGDVAASPMGAPALLEVRSDGTFDGSTGCRAFSGKWIERGDQIVVPSWGMDVTECPARLSRQDDQVVSVIGDGFIPSLEGDLLTLIDPGGVGLVYRSGQ
ncbi:MAG TPA: META domain-containing protein [Candidatus Limnocylindria bacterium]